MTAFHELIEAQLAGGHVRCSYLVSFDFRSGPFHVWPGTHDLIIGTGDAAVTYRGLADLGTLSAVNAGPGQAIEEITFTLVGSAALTEHFREDAEEAAGREVTVWLQFFDVRRFDGAGRWVDWQTVDVPIQVFWGRMGPLAVDRPAVEVGSQITRTLTVRAQNAFVNRRRPAFGFYSDRDQKARSSGDNLFIYASRLADKQVTWPYFS